MLESQPFMGNVGVKMSFFSQIKKFLYHVSLYINFVIEYVIIL